MATPAQRIVILAVDNSEYSEKAFEFYANHFHRPENKVMVLNTPELVLDPDSPRQKIESAVMDCKAKTDMIKNKFVAMMSKAGMTGEFMSVEDKNIGHGIVSQAEAVGASYIVTGSRGLSTVRRTLLGSVSDYILHHSSVPVLVCRTDTHV